MKNKKNNYLGLFSILMLSILGIIISCSTKDKNPLGLDEILGDQIDIIEHEIIDQFKQNYVGDYTPEDSATINMEGYKMIFSGLDIRISTTTNSNNDLILDIYINTSHGVSTLSRVTFIEGDETHPPYKQVIVPETATNILLKNVYGTASGHIIKGNNIIELTVNPNNGDLIFDGVKIGTKQ